MSTNVYDNERILNSRFVVQSSIFCHLYATLVLASFLTLSAAIFKIISVIFNVSKICSSLVVYRFEYMTLFHLWLCDKVISTIVALNGP